MTASAAPHMSHKETKKKNSMGTMSPDVERGVWDRWGRFLIFEKYFKEGKEVSASINQPFFFYLSFFTEYITDVC